MNKIQDILVETLIERDIPEALEILGITIEELVDEAIYNHIRDLSETKQADLIGELI